MIQAPQDARVENSDPEDALAEVPKLDNEDTDNVDIEKEIENLENDIGKTEAKQSQPSPAPPAESDIFGQQQRAHPEPSMFPRQQQTAAEAIFGQQQTAAQAIFGQQQPAPLAPGTFPRPHQAPRHGVFHETYNVESRLANQIQQGGPQATDSKYPYDYGWTNCIRVQRLSEVITEDMIKEHFSQCGKVLKVEFLHRDTDLHTLRASLGFCIAAVWYENFESVKKAVYTLQDSTINQSMLDVFIHLCDMSHFKTCFIIGYPPDYTHTQLIGAFEQISGVRVLGFENKGNKYGFLHVCGEENMHRMIQKMDGFTFPTGKPTRCMVAKDGTHSLHGRKKTWNERIHGLRKTGGGGPRGGGNFRGNYQGNMNGGNFNMNQRGNFQGRGNNQRGNFRGRGNNQRGNFRGRYMNQMGNFRGIGMNQRGNFRGRGGNQRGNFNMNQRGGFMNNRMNSRGEEMNQNHARNDSVQEKDQNNQRNYYVHPDRMNRRDENVFRGGRGNGFRGPQRGGYGNRYEPYQTGEKVNTRFQTAPQDVFVKNPATGVVSKVSREKYEKIIDDQESSQAEI